MHPIPLTVAALAVACAAYFTSLSAHGAECVETMSSVEQTLQADGATYEIIGPDNLAAFALRVFPLTGVPASEVTGAIVAFDGLAFGIETRDGCFSPAPIMLPASVGA